MADQEYTKYLIESVAYSFEDDAESSETENYSVNKKKVYDAYETLKLIGPEEYDPKTMESAKVVFYKNNTKRVFGKEMGKCYVATRDFFYKNAEQHVTFYTGDMILYCYWKIPHKVILNQIGYDYIASVSYIQTLTGEEYLVIDSIDKTPHENYLNRIIYDFHTKTFEYHYYYDTYMTKEAPVQYGLTDLSDYRLTYIQHIRKAIREIFRAFKIKIK